MKNMPHTTWIPYSLIFLCKKPLTILSIKFTQKRNFPKSAVKQIPEDYNSKRLRSARFSWNRIYTNRWLFHGRSIINNTSWYSHDSNRNDVVKSLKPLFYKRYLHDIYSRRRKNCTDQLYHALNSYHPKVNLTIDINPKKLFDTQVITKNGKIETAVYR